MAVEIIVNPGQAFAPGRGPCAKAVGQMPAAVFAVAATPMELIEWAHGQTQLAHFLMQPCVGDDDESSECLRAIDALLEPVLAALSLALARLPGHRPMRPVDAWPPSVAS